MDKATDKATCPNCSQAEVGHVEDVCMLAALSALLRDRGLSAEAIAEIAAKVDTNALWDDLGPIVDKLEEGAYDPDNEED